MGGSLIAGTGKVKTEAINEPIEYTHTAQSVIHVHRFNMTFICTAIVLFLRLV